ncbi:CBS-domain-containing protein [Coccomyxa subellipsoidea C-169]|uniref:CBS-domain-containing protein n=1 Tax=Coccomyxa subellipsoidea (strain C-169) TaxID=574566 RepID=I0YP83_COCSC|nr:CBS-domain-containing protein [Coccomyxa subellipsoidea C-169]EIE20202.1 CBS-domain-containing protein [Coccomyxa subellipsoidea C-169]|eukprot:XP_005644746.1 CBS-domain-containing protein [Coccomyxa subellipsoidea C-169]
MGEKEFDCQLRKLTTGTKLSTLLRERPLVVLKQETTVELTLQTLAGRKILSAPVVGPPEGVDPSTFTTNTAGQDVVCFVDIRDILVSFLKELDDDIVHNAKMLKRMQVLEEKGTDFATRPLRSLPVIGGDGTFFQNRAAAMTLHELIHDTFLYPKETKAIFGGSKTQRVVHRAALFDKEGKITHIISQSDIASFLYEHRDLLGDLGNKTAKELGWAKLNVITVKADTAALEALALMADKDIAGVGVVSDEGALIGNFSFSDLRALCAEHFSSMALPVAEFLALEHGTEYWGAAAGVKQTSDAEPGSPAARFAHNGELRQRSPSVGHKVGQALVLATPNDTFAEILEKLVTKHLHRLYVVDDMARPIGIVTLTDILRMVMQQSR